MHPESMTDLADSLTRERAVKGFVIICLVIAMAWYGERGHTYLPIILFALLADLFALNRLRRLVRTLQSGKMQVGDIEGDDPETCDEQD